MVRRVCNRVAVMYLGEVVEIADNERLFFDPGHPYTKALLSAMPTLEERRYKPEDCLLEGEPPSPLDIPSGCSFRSRCPRAMQKCDRLHPILTVRERQDFAACHLVTQPAASGGSERCTLRDMSRHCEETLVSESGRQCRDNRGASMSFTEHRLELIRDLLRQKQRVHVKDLVDHLKVSHESIRRDLRELETQGFARRVYGGAVIDQQESDQPFAERLRVGQREKARIGEAAAALVKDGMKIFVDEGTTALACLKHIETARI
jgi:oligopeptide/dipeptide ABC transporter ATP-binding protein